MNSKTMDKLECKIDATTKKYILYKSFGFKRLEEL